MKRISIATVLVLMLAVVVIGTSTVLAAKPQNVINKSNGFPSGPHFNLNIHGKKDGYICNSTAGGGSVFVSLYGTSTIQYVSNKKASLTELRVLDPCAESFDGDPIKVQLPSEGEGYYVFARILAKPNNGSNGGESSVVLYPNPVLQACNDDPANPDPNFGNYTDCSDALLALGLVTNRGVYQATEAGFVRFDPNTDEKGKGKSKAQDITGLFMWTGYVFDASLDINGDGVIDENDLDTNGNGVIDEGDEGYAYDVNGNGIIDPDEMEAWVADQVEAGNATFYDNVWVFNIADLVVQEQDIVNDGTKLLQVRFYPVATTEFTR